MLICKTCGHQLTKDEEMDKENLERCPNCINESDREAIVEATH